MVVAQRQDSAKRAIQHPLGRPRRKGIRLESRKLIFAHSVIRLRRISSEIDIDVSKGQPLNFVDCPRNHLGTSAIPRARAVRRDQLQSPLGPPAIRSMRWRVPGAACVLPGSLKGMVATQAYIKSQAHEGWKLVRERYDDGGFSGGSMERQAPLRAGR